LKFLKLFKRQITRISWFSLLILCVSSSLTVHAQTDNTPFPQATELKQGSPLTNQEFVRLLYQLSSHPEGRDDVIDEIRKRGIGFPLTAGLRSLAATKSGNDSTLLHTLDEAERRRMNPTADVRPNIAEATELLERTRQATLAAADKMPD